MFNADDSIDDLNMRWRGCFVAIKEKDVLHPFSIDGFTRNTGGINVVGSIYKEEIGDWASKVILANNPSLVTDKVLPRAFNHNGRALYMHWNSRRTTKRGMSGDSCALKYYSVKSFIPVRLQDIGFRGLPSSVYYALMNPTYYDIKQAVIEIEKGATDGVAISKNIIVGIHPHCEFLLLYNRSFLVGEITPDLKLKFLPTVAKETYNSIAKETNLEVL